MPQSCNIALFHTDSFRDYLLDVQRLFCIVGIYRLQEFEGIITRDSVAIARICYGNSVCLSVCPSVRLSHGWISQKRLKLGSRSFHHTVAPSL